MGERGTVGHWGTPGDYYYNLAGWTFIIVSTVAPCRGRIRTFDFRVKTAGSFKIKIFGDDGTNYVFISERQSISLSVGEHLLVPIGINIEKDNLIAYYSADGEAGYCDGVSGDECWKSGDITTSTAKSLWTYGYPCQFRGHIFSKGAYIL